MDWANVGMIIIGYQCDFLAIPSVLLDSEGDFEFHQEFLWLTMKTMNIDDSTFAVEKIPIAWNECFNDAFLWVFVFVKS